MGFFQQITRKASLLPFSQFLQSFHIILMQKPVRHRRDIQKKCCISTNRPQINMDQFLQAFYLIILFRMIKPSRPDRGIYLCRIPDQGMFAFKDGTASKVFHITGDLPLAEFFIIRLLASFLNTFCQGCPRRNYTPLRFSYIAGFISTPPDVRSADADAGLWLIVPYTCIISLPVINLLLSIRTFPTGPVQPDTEDFSIPGQKFRQLCNIIVVIFFPASITWLIPVPRRKIDSKLQSITTAGIRDFLYYISCPILPWT